MHDKAVEHPLPLEGPQAEPRLRKGRGFASSTTLPDVYRLKAFLVLAEELNYSRAAERLMMSQSPLSQLIISLERDAGFRLFDRTKHSVKLTPAGESFRVDATMIVDLVHVAIERARVLRDAGEMPA